MSFFPESRQQALSKLDEEDRLFLKGYWCCMVDAADYFEYIGLSDYDAEKGSFVKWMRLYEMMLLYSLFDDPKYEDIALDDVYGDEYDDAEDYLDEECESSYTAEEDFDPIYDPFNGES